MPNIFVDNFIIIIIINFSLFIYLSNKTIRLRIYTHRILRGDKPN